MHMTLQGIVICSMFFLLEFNRADKPCFEQSNEVNYLFLNEEISRIKIPLLPLDCLHCQSAYQVCRSIESMTECDFFQVEIQLIEEQAHINRTIQRIKIFLKNFEIEDSSYICLRNTCPILVEHGSDFIGLNITSSLFSHVFLSPHLSKSFHYLFHPNTFCYLFIEYIADLYSRNLSSSSIAYSNRQSTANLRLSGDFIRKRISIEQVFNSLN